MPFTCLLWAAVLGQDYDLPATDDRAGTFARSYLAFIKVDPRKAGSVRRLPAAFYYGKAKLLMTYPQGRWEQAHLGICRSMLDLLDVPSGQEIKRIQEANPNREVYEIKPDDLVDFNERFSVLMGFEDPEVSELERWTSSAGYSLGELAANLITWHYIGTTKEGQARFHASLDRIAERARNAPSKANLLLIKQMTLLGQLERREKYTLEQLKVVALRIEAALNTVLPPPGSK